jgi:hypothetical protein
LVYPGFGFFPWWITGLFVIGLVFLALRWREHREWLVVLAFFFALVWLSPFVFKSPSYVVRMRAMLPVFVMPVVAYAVMHVVRPLSKATKAPEWVFVVLASGLLLYPGYVDYKEFQPRMAGEHVYLEKWDVFQWIQANSAEDAKVLFVTGGYQASPTLLKRRAAVVEVAEWQRRMQEFIASNQTLPASFEVEWSSLTLRHTHKYHKSFWSFGTYEDPPTRVSVDEFDFVYIENLNEQMVPVNVAVMQALMKRGFEPAYQRGPISVLRKVAG